MSPDKIPSDRLEDRSGSRTAVRIILGTTVVGAILYLLVGQRLQNASEEVRATNQKQERVMEQLGEIERRSEQQNRQLETFQQRLSDGATLDDETLQAMLARLRNLEEKAPLSADVVESLTSQASEVEGERARNRVNLIEAYEIGRRIEPQLNDLEQRITDWTGHLAYHRTSDIGQKIATRPDLVRKFAALDGLKVASFDDLDRWHKQFQALYARIKLAHDDPQIHAVVIQADIDGLTTLESHVTGAHEQIRQQQRALEVIESTASGLDPGQRTLADAMQEVQLMRDDAYLQQLVETTQAAIREVDEQYAAKIAAEQRQQRELLKQQELEAEQLETKRRAEELEEIQREREELEARIAQQKLIAEYGRDMGTINSLLAPFLDNAITQPSRTNPISKGGPMKPTSLDALRSSGALAETDDGLELLFKVGGHPANMRKKGSFPSFISPRPLKKGSEQALVQRAQQLLIKYGELLVDDKKLSP